MSNNDSAKKKKQPMGTDYVKLTDYILDRVFREVSLNRPNLYS